MSYKKIETGKWKVRYGKRHPVSGLPFSRRATVSTEAEAKRKEREFIAELDQLFKEKIVPKWSVVVDQYVKNCRELGLAEGTIYNTKVSVEAATKSTWGNLPVDEITTAMIANLVKVEYKDHSDSTKKNMLKYVRVIFKFALECGYVKIDPTPRLAFRLGDKIKRVLTEEQARTLLTSAKAMDWPWYPHYAAALYTGMRNGELYALMWNQVNFDLRQIVVNRSWCRKGGFKSTKSGDDRIVEIAPNLLHIFKELKLNTGECPFVLPHMREWETGDQARELRRFLIGIGLPQIRFHDLRASWATMMLSKGIPPVKVMMMGGWKDMKTMMIYMRKAGIDIKGITDCLNIHDPVVSMGKLVKLSIM